MSSTEDKKKDKKDEALLLGQGPPPRSLRKLFGYALRVWGVLAALMFFIIASAVLDLARPWILWFMLLDQVIKKNDPARLPFVLMLLAGTFVGQQVADFFKDVLQELANQRLINNIRCDLYRHTMALPVRFFDRGRTGDMISRMTGDIDTVDSFLDTLMQDIGNEVVMLVGTLIAMVAISGKLTLVLLPTVVALGASVFFFRKPVKKISRRVRNMIGDMSTLAEETISGVRVVKAFCAEIFEFARFSAKSQEVLRGRVRAKKLSAFYSSSAEVCIFAGTLLVVVMAVPWVLSGATIGGKVFTVGALVAYLHYLNKLYSPVKKLSKINLSVQKILASADRVFEVIQLPPEPVDGFYKQPVLPAALPAVRQIPAQLSGAVQFDHVSFGYDPNNPVLKNFTLRVEPGEVVALVGPSGAGKTTVVNLLLRFYEPTAGRILMDGIPISDLPLASLRLQIGVVSQETFLFSGSGRENIAYATPGATQEQVIAAARAAHAHNFLTESSEGYNTEVGERGVQLSGGQRQRVAIARALLRNPRIMIFDEATSHLDSESEQLIQEALERVGQGRTVFVVAHRLSTIRRADKIVVIENGEAVEVGKHDELLAREGIYRKLYMLQMSAPDAGSFTEDGESNGA